MTKTKAALPVENQENILNDHIYLVTGATGGLGQAVSMQLAKLGATVILSGRNEERLNQIYDQIEQSGYPTPAIISFDLEQTDETLYKQLATSIYNEFKRLDGIVHCACQLGIIGPMASQDSAMWLKTQQINVNAAAILSKACLPLLHQANNASITFISDSSARQSKAYWGSYGVSKVAIESLSAMLADELENTNIVSNVYIPGPCTLPIRKKTHPGEEKPTLDTADHIAKKIANCVLSDESGFCFF